MPQLISDAEFAEFKSLMKDAHDTFNTKVITWYRKTTKTNRFGEDVLGHYTLVPLNVLLNYNYMRTWPITLTTETGELDKQTVQVMINKQYLTELGYIRSEGRFDYNPDVDRFDIDGLVYKAFGDTPVSQTGGDDILITIILKREETQTGDISNAQNLL